jgi:hypothetical protein
MQGRCQSATANDGLAHDRQWHHLRVDCLSGYSAQICTCGWACIRDPDDCIADHHADAARSGPHTRFVIPMIVLPIIARMRRNLDRTQDEE